MSTTDAPGKTASPHTGRRGVFPARPAFAGTAIAFTSLYLAAGAPTPLLVLYQKQWHFPAAVLTLAFAVYAIGFLAALLTVGSLSDHVGRRPVLIGALAVHLVSMAMFLLAPDIGWVIAARVVQGAATGAATSAFTAALVELATPGRKRLAAVLGSVGMTGGLAGGSLLAGVAIQFTPVANSAVFIVLSAVAVLGIVVVALAPETASRAPGAMRSLVPRIAVPPAIRAEFLAATPVIVTVWMLAGLSLGLAPTIVRSVFLLESGLLNGICGSIAPAVSAVFGVVIARRAARVAMLIGIHASMVGAVVIVTGVLQQTLSIMILGQIIAGVGFGAAFSATLRLIMPLVATHERAAVATGVYLVAYVAFALPVVIAGLLAAPVGLLPTISGYGATACILAFIGLSAQIRISRRTRG
jgi:hypothetical protein